MPTDANAEFAKQLKLWFDRCPEIGDRDLSIEEERALAGLLGTPGFHVFWGLMLGKRQALLVEVCNTALVDARATAVASRLQGAVNGIDTVRDVFQNALIKPEANPSAASTETEQEYGDERTAGGTDGLGNGRYG